MTTQLDTKRRKKATKHRDALDRFLGEIKIAHQIFCSTTPRPGAAKALLAVQDYLRSVVGRNSVGLDLPFSELYGALADAERGIKNPLTQPNEYLGGSKQRILEGRNLAIASVAVTLFIDAGLNQNEALQKVAANIRSKNHKELKTFRDHILRKRMPPEIVWSYARWLENGRFAKWDDSKPTKIQRAQKLNDVVRRIFPNGNMTL